MAEKEEDQKEAGCSGLNNDNHEEGVTMLDVLKDATELEEDAKAVLGAADEKHCTYLGQGYAKRQALYACMTCAKKAGNELSGGVCLACSYHCHESHDLVELYTKRNFRCDCGNTKICYSSKQNTVLGECIVTN